MVRYIKQTGFQMGEFLEDTDSPGNDRVSIENGIVISIDDFLAGTVLDIGGIASRPEFAESFRIAFVICRAVAADGVQDDESILFDAGDIFLEIVEKNFIEAALTVAIARVVAFVNVSGGNTVADAFATVIVFQPEDVKAGLTEQIHQVFGEFEFTDTECFLRQIGEHARDRNGCRRTAGIDILKSDDVFPGKQRIGIAGIAIERKVGGTRGFADDENEDGRYRIVTGDVHGILVQWHEGLENE